MDSRKKPGGCPSQRFASKDPNEPWYGQWVGADRDHIVIYDGKDVFGTGQRFFLSTQASLLYEGLFDPFVPRPSHERLALISLRLDGKDKVRQACVFSRADHGMSLFLSRDVRIGYNFGGFFYQPSPRRRCTASAVL